MKFVSLYICIFIQALPLYCQFKDVDTFKKYLTQNITEKKVSLKDKQGSTQDYTQITLNNQTYYYQHTIGSEGCNGTSCIEEEFILYSSNFKQKVSFICWGNMGFFTDINSDGNLDFININETDKHIYEEDTFMVEMYSLQKNFEFQPHKNEQGESYYIKIYWPGGLFGNAENQPIYILDQRWFFEVK